RTSGSWRKISGRRLPRSRPICKISWKRPDHERPHSPPGPGVLLPRKNSEGAFAMMEPPSSPAPPHPGGPELSVVVPLFNEQENLEVLYGRLVRSLEELGASFEIVLVNDGSHDATPALLDALRQKDARVVVIHLSRNFGHQGAVCA